MKITKKVTSIVLALMLVISAFAGLSITAGAAPTESSATLHIYKSEANPGTAGDGTQNTTIENNNLGIDGVTFTAYYQGNLETEVPDEPNKSGQTYTGTTANGGTAEIEIPSANFGLYYVEETDKPSWVDTDSVSFYVYVPMTAANGSTYMYDIYTYPKNTVTDGAALMTKQFDGANVTDALTFTQNAEFSLVDNTGAVDIITGIKITSDGTVHEYSYSGATQKYRGIKVYEYMGKVLATGVPAGTYYFVETENAITSDNTVYGLNTAHADFTITSGQAATPITVAGDSFGTGANVVSAGTINNSETPSNITKVADVDTQTIGENVVWTITPDIPSDIASYQSYVITDTVPKELDIAQSGSVSMTVGGTAYTTVTPTISEPDGDGNKTVTIDFSDHVADLYDNDTSSVKALEIKITTTINNEAVVDTNIENTVRLGFTNAAGTTGNAEDSDTVLTGGVQIQKVDAETDAGLDGAVFKLYKADGTSEITVSEVDAEAGIYEVDPDGTATITSPDSGVITIQGLAYGSYKIEETKAPSGYQLLIEQKDITVSAESDVQVLTGNKIPNVPTPDLPLTGGMGTIIFTVAGLVLIGGAAFFFIRSRKSHKEEA